MPAGKTAKADALKQKQSKSQKKGLVTTGEFQMTKVPTGELDIILRPVRERRKAWFRGFQQHQKAEWDGRRQ